MAWTRGRRLVPESGAGARRPPARGGPPQPAVHGLAAHAVAVGDLDHLESVAQHFHDGVEAWLCHCELQEHTPDLLTSPLIGEARRTGGHVNHPRQFHNPSAGINTTSINRISTTPAQGRLSADCQQVTASIRCDALSADGFGRFQGLLGYLTTTLRSCGTAVVMRAGMWRGGGRPRHRSRCHDDDATVGGMHRQ
jgi:hypothetical protein